MVTTARTLHDGTLAKTCARCKQEKPVTDFSPRKRKIGPPTSWHSYCKVCNNEKVRALDARRQAEDPVANGRRKRAVFIRKYFGLTMEEYEQIVAEYLEKQGNVCAICRKPPPKGRQLALDHCHRTEKRRGLLCYDCNRGLGCFADNPELMERGAAYLKG